jgi:hypothetical protein
VARNQPASRSGPQAIVLPSVRSSVSASTCSPKVPAPWWFLPWTSFAIAPPSVT